MNISKSERGLRYLLIVWIVLFTFASLVFLIAGNRLFSLLNDVTLWAAPSLKLIPPSQERFWLALALSLMTLLIWLCYEAQKDLKKNLICVKMILVSKFASTFFFFLFFAAVERLGAYLTGMVVDGSIFLVTFYFYRQVEQQGQNS